MTAPISTTEKWLLIIWGIFLVVIGLFIVQDYGIVIDEPAYYLYAEQSTATYKSLFGHRFEPTYGPSNHRYYGPAFIMGIGSVIKWANLAPTDPAAIPIWHFSYFTFFILTGVCLYLLVRRWFEMWPAWGVLALFTTQPLLWGHAFINPKDIPFMLFFSLSILQGYRMVDHFGTDPPIVGACTWKFLTTKWQQINYERRKRFLCALAIISTSALLGGIFANSILEVAFRFVFNAEPNSWKANLLLQIAPNANVIPVENYILKSQIIFGRFFWGLITCSLIVILVDLFAVQLRTICHPRNLNFQPGIGKRFFQFLFSPKIIMAGVVLGITMAVRVIGPLAGGIVLFYLWFSNRKRFLPVAISYLLWAVGVTYLLWPYLWLAPVSRFIETLQMMSQFPWTGEVLFNGTYYHPTEIPRAYLPTLIHIQFTEPLIVIVYLGFGLLFWRFLKKGVKIDQLFLILLGALGPIIGFIILKSPMYDNFRQIFFLLPGIFVVSAYFWETVSGWFHSKWTRIILILGLALPGLIAIYQLHPYEYIYYNSFIGGPAGAFRRFETDYWQTATLEVATELNEITAPGDKIIVDGTLRLIRYYLRPDVIVERVGNETFDLDGDYDYALLPSRWERDLVYPEAPTIKVIERQGAVLSVIKAVRGQIYHPK